MMKRAIIFFSLFIITMNACNNPDNKNTGVLTNKKQPSQNPVDSLMEAYH